MFLLRLLLVLLLGGALVGCGAPPAAGAPAPLPVLPSGPAPARLLAEVTEGDAGGATLPVLSDRLAPPQAVLSPVNARKLLTAFVAPPGDRLLVTSEELQDGELLGHLRSAAGRERVDVAAPGEEATPAGTHRCASTLYMHAKVMVVWRQGA